MSRHRGPAGTPTHQPPSRQARAALLAAFLLCPLLGAMAGPAAAAPHATALVELRLTGAGRLSIAFRGGSDSFENASGGSRDLGGFNLAPGTVVTLTATTPLGQEFLGWDVAGVYRNWAPTLTFTVTGDVLVGATFQARPAFSDVPPFPSNDAIFHLAGHNFVRGYGDGTFGPRDPILRAQMAALITRAMSWQDQRYPATFTDRCIPTACVDDELWVDVNILAFHNVVRGYDQATFAPFDPVSTVQMVSVVTRAMVARGYWANQPERADLYPNVPAPSGHRQDLATYIHYAGALPVADQPYSDPLPGWDQPTARATFADVFWLALDRTLSRPESRYFPDAPLP